MSLVELKCHFLHHHNFIQKSAELSFRKWYLRNMSFDFLESEVHGPSWIQLPNEVEYPHAE